MILGRQPNENSLSVTLEHLAVQPLFTQIWIELYLLYTRLSNVLLEWELVQNHV
jgi:hypothetical protein